MVDVCIYCGTPVPEGRMVCPICENAMFVAHKEKHKKITAIEKLSMCAIKDPFELASNDCPTDYFGDAIQPKNCWLRTGSEINCCDCVKCWLQEVMR